MTAILNMNLYNLVANLLVVSARTMTSGEAHGDSFPPKLAEASRTLYRPQSAEGSMAIFRPHASDQLPILPLIEPKDPELDPSLSELSQIDILINILGINQYDARYMAISPPFKSAHKILHESRLPNFFKQQGDL